MVTSARVVIGVCTVDVLLSGLVSTTPVGVATVAVFESATFVGVVAAVDASTATTTSSGKGCSRT